MLEAGKHMYEQSMSWQNQTAEPKTRVEKAGNRCVSHHGLVMPRMAASISFMIEHSNGSENK